MKVTRDFSSSSKADIYQFYSLKPKVGDEVSMTSHMRTKSLSIVKIEPADNVIVNHAATACI